MLIALDSGQDCTLQVFSDSTGNSTIDWVYQMALRLAALYPQYDVQYRLWDESAQQYGPTQHLTANRAYLTCTGDAGARVGHTSIPSFESDPDVRVLVQPAEWPFSAPKTFFAHHGVSGARQLWFWANEAGYLALTWSEDGTLNRTAVSSVPASIGTVSPTWVRATLDLDSGGSQCAVKFYTSTDGAAWAQVGSTVYASGPTHLSSIETDWTLGVYAQTGYPFSGRIYEVDLRDGIDAWPPINTQTLGVWNRGDLLLNAPVLRVLNAAMNGATAQTWVDRAASIIDAGQLLTIVSLSHNHGTSTDRDFVWAYSDLCGRVTEKCPYTKMAFCSQNQQIPPASGVPYHARRRLNLCGHAALRGCSFVDIYPAFEGREQELMLADGVHPNAAGGAIWADTMIDWLQQGD